MPMFEELRSDALRLDEPASIERDDRSLSAVCDSCFVAELPRSSSFWLPRSLRKPESGASLPPLVLPLAPWRVPLPLPPGACRDDCEPLAPDVPP